MKILFRFLLLLSCVHSTGAFSYEDDVHYGLTKWLALKAGFRAEDAEILATGSKDVDGGALDAVRLVLFSACISRDVRGADQVLLHHFPSGATIPSDPRKREVVPNSKAALSLSNDRITNPKAEQARNLRDFGTGIHALQDSFSHRGVPDVPQLFLFNCYSDYAFGHPKDRGGWSSHDTDLTYLYPDVALEMAKSTWEQLCRYRKEVDKAGCGRDWKDISGPASVFIRGKTKGEKWAWFRSDEGTRNQFKCDFIADINLGDGNFPGCDTPSYARTDIGSKLFLQTDVVGIVAAQRAEDPRQIVEKTLKTWFVDRDVVALARYFVDANAFKAINGMPNYSEDKRIGTTAAQFALWLVRDHGSVHSSLGLKAPALENHPIVRLNLLGRGEREFNFPAGTRLVKYSSLNDAFYTIDAGAKIFDLKIGNCKNGSGQCAIAAARLKKAPYENLLIEYRRINGLWKIQQKWSLVDH